MDQLSLLGAFKYATDADAPVEVSNPKARALLAYVARSPACAAPRTLLASLLWAETENNRARANLRKTVSRLNQSLADAGAAQLISTPTEIALDTNRVCVDATEVDAASAAGTPDR